MGDSEIDESSGSNFVDTLRELTSIGWYHFGPVSDSGDSLLFVRFHTHPDNADSIYDLVKSCLEGDGFWYFERSSENRFYICPAELKLKSEEIGNLQQAVDQILQEKPDLGRAFSKALIGLSERLQSHI
jgi:hypothetical protein